MKLSKKFSRLINYFQSVHFSNFDESGVCLCVHVCLWQMPTRIVNCYWMFKVLLWFKYIFKRSYNELKIWDDKNKVI